MARSASIQFSVITDLVHASEAALQWRGRHVVSDDGSDDLGARMLRVLERKPYFIVVHGDDRLVARVVTAYQQELRHHGFPLRLLPLLVGELTTVSESVAQDLTPGRVAKLLSKKNIGVEDLETILISCLKVSSSASAGAQYGFSFGVGWLYKAFEAYHRSGHHRRTGVTLAATVARLTRDTVVSGRGSWQPQAARVSVDYHARAEHVGYLAASTLERTWLGLRAANGQEVALNVGATGTELLKQVAEASWLSKLAPSKDGPSSETFERLHIDLGAAGFVLDGELCHPDRPHVVQVMAGPRVHFVYPVKSRLKTLARAVGVGR